MANKNTSALSSKKALPNKLLNSDGSITDLNGNAISNPVPAYQSKPALPNKFLNADGTYSTLSEIIGSAIDTDLFIIVDELPATGEPNKIYLVPKTGGGFVEWAYNDGQWDTIGELEVDLSDYVRKDGDTMSGPLQVPILTVGTRQNGAVGAYSSVEGRGGIASGDYSHAEGDGSTSSGARSHAENGATTASGDSSHSEGSNTVANGRSSHAEGFGTYANKKSQHVEGEYNILDTGGGGNSTARGSYIHIAGNGVDQNNKSNAHTLEWDGTAWFAGDVYVGSTSGTNKDAGSKKLATREYVDTQIGAALNNSY